MAASTRRAAQASRRRSGAPPRGARNRALARSESLAGWAFVTPASVIILLFGAVPIVWSLVMSFQQNNLLSPQTPFVGLRNYRQLIHDPAVLSATGHTIVYTALFVPGTMIVGLFLAVAMNRQIRFIWLLPHRRLRDDGHLHDQRGAGLHLAVRPVLRDRQLRVQPARPAAAAVPERPVAGARRDRGDDDLGLVRVRGGHLPGRAAGRAQGTDRGRGDRRGRPVGDVPPDHAAAAQPRVAVPGRLADDQRAAAVRRGVPVHPGRPARRHHRGRLLPVCPGVPELHASATPRRSPTCCSS